LREVHTQFLVVGAADGLADVVGDDMGKNVVADVATTIMTAVQWAMLSWEVAKIAASAKILP
jgi:hypothetical protein